VVSETSRLAECLWLIQYVPPVLSLTMSRTERESNHLVHLVPIRISGAMPPGACRNGVHWYSNLSTVVGLTSGHDLKLHCYMFLRNPFQFMMHYASEHSSLCSLTWRRVCVCVYIYIHTYIHTHTVIPRLTSDAANEFFS
jgi:hypothetical protein